jgi:hypothetical protein
MAKTFESGTRLLQKMHSTYLLDESGKRWGQMEETAFPVLFAVIDREQSRRNVLKPFKWQRPSISRW